MFSLGSRAVPAILYKKKVTCLIPIKKTIAIYTFIDADLAKIPISRRHVENSNEGARKIRDRCVEMRQDRIELSKPIWLNLLHILKNRPLRREIFKNPELCWPETTHNPQVQTISLRAEAFGAPCRARQVLVMLVFAQMILIALQSKLARIWQQVCLFRPVWSVN